MTILRFPQRLADELRLAIHAACDEGDVEVAERLSSVLRRYVPGPCYLPRGYLPRVGAPVAEDTAETGSGAA